MPSLCFDFRKTTSPLCTYGLLYVHMVKTKRDTCMHACLHKKIEPEYLPCIIRAIQEGCAPGIMYRKVSNFSDLRVIKSLIDDCTHIVYECSSHFLGSKYKNEVKTHKI